MKNLLRYLVLLSFFFGGINQSGLFAQKILSGDVSKTSIAYDHAGAAWKSADNTRQLLTQTLFYGDTPMAWTLNDPSTGYVIGTNSYNDQGKYQRFDFEGSASLAEVRIYFGEKDITGTADNFTFVVKTVGPDDAPNNTLYSQVYSTTVIDVSDPADVYNTFVIDPPVNVSSTFFAGIEWDPNIDDEFSIIGDDEGEGDLEFRAWEKESQGNYIDMFSSWGDFDIDLWIAAVLEDLTIPDPPVLLLPADNATEVLTDPTFSWNASVGATTYRLQVSANADFSTTFFDQENIIGTSQQVTGLANSTLYYWHVNATNEAGTSEYSGARSFTTAAPVFVEQIDYEIPATFSLRQNYPNPFNPATKIEFSLPHQGHVTFNVYNSMGQEVAQLISKEMGAGTYTTEWNASGFASGIYFYRIQLGNSVINKKMILMK